MTLKALKARKQLWFVAICCLLITLWQAGFYASENPESTYRIDHQFIGFYSSPNKIFFYFLHYLDLYPVGTVRPLTDYSLQGAIDQIQKYGSELIMEMGVAARIGDSGKILLYYPDIWSGGDIRNPSLIPANALVFCLSLLSLFFSLTLVGRPLLALLFVIFLGSNPFQIFEVYHNNNVFSWTISSAIWILAFCIPWLHQHPMRAHWNWIISIAIGAVLACIREVRSEPLALLPFILASVLFYRPLSLRRRFAVATTVLCSFFLLGNLWTQYWANKIEYSSKVVAEAGGTPMPKNLRQSHHEFWHPIWCGLGDFDTKYGYEWHDPKAYGYAHPILKEKFGLDIPWSGKWEFPSFYDPVTQIYRRVIFDYPEYHQIIRDKVVHDVKSDPLWYLDILRKRSATLLTETTPVRLSIGSLSLTFPWSGQAALIALIFFCLIGRWFEVKVILFTVSTSATAFLIYSKGGSTYYSLYHLSAGALTCCWAIRFVAAKIKSSPILFQTLDLLRSFVITLKAQGR